MAQGYREDKFPNSYFMLEWECVDTKHFAMKSLSGSGLLILSFYLQICDQYREYVTKCCGQVPGLQYL